MIRDILINQKREYNAVVSHPLQSYEWGEFREKSGIRIIRKGIFKNDTLVDGFQITIHPIPHTKWNIGYFPKGTLPTPETIEELKKIGKENNCIFIQIEPNIKKGKEHEGMDALLSNSPVKIVKSAHPLFTPHTFVLDLTKTEEELLKSMHPKTRYNIKVAQKHEVVVTEEESNEAFQKYLSLMWETTKRNGFYAHTAAYHTTLWETLKGNKDANDLQAHLFLAHYQKEVVVAWMLFVFHDTLYYPYGSSSTKYREVMASNLVMWEAIKYGKTNDLTLFDMWGALGENPDPKDPWFGFHRFKQGYGATLTEFVGSFDVVINPLLYEGYKIADKLRWFILKAKKLSS